MATTQENFNFAELDFDEIRSSIVEYLRGQSEFQDVDFEGSAISYLVDALAYSQAYMSYHANMAVSETFLQSARLRENVVAKAKELGYIPHSATAAKSEIEIVYTYPSHDANDPRTDFIIPRGTQFNSNIEKTFVTLEDVTLSNVAGTNDYKATIEVYEGRLTEFTHVLDTGGPTERIQIPTDSIDLESLKVSLIDSPGAWFRADSIQNLGPRSSVYFVQEGPSNDYEIYFGDDILGRNPGAGQGVTIQYLVTSATEGNGASTYELAATPAAFVGAGGSFSYDSITRSRNGSEREGIEAIRHSAPIAFQAQNRGVTKEDYYSLLRNEFGYIEAINVWGGEDNDPPFYGRVFISIKPRTGTNLSSITKKIIEDRVQEKFSVMAITPQVVDADFIFVKPETVVTYLPERTIRTKGQIAGEVKERTQEFFDSNISQFDEVLRYSKLIQVIDETNEAIVGNTTNFTLIKKLEPTPNRLIAYRMDFFNKLQPGTVESVPFENDGKTISFKDDGVGGMTLFVNGKAIRSGIGKVDYEKGVVEITRYVFRTDYGFEFSMTARPVLLDIFSKRNALIQYDTGHTVTIQERDQDD